MSEFFIPTVCTVISGVVVFILGQLYVEFVLRPIQDFKILKAKIAKTLIYYANCYGNPRRIADSADAEKWRKGSDEIRVLAAEISAFSEIMPPRYLVLNNIPNEKDLLKASENLIGLSNSFFADKDEIKFTLECVKIVRESLGIHKR